MKQAEATRHPRGRIAALLRMCALAVGLQLLAACTGLQGHPSRQTDPLGDLDSIAELLKASAVTACTRAPSLTCRNELTAARMLAIDTHYALFEERLFKDARAIGFGTTLGTLGLTTAAAASSGGTAQLLAGLSALAIGGREAYHKEVLTDRTVLALHASMRSRRAVIALRLRRGMMQSVSQYSVAMALTDLGEYYFAGTLLGALIEITEVAGARTQAAEQETRTLIDYRVDPPATRLRAALCPAGAACDKFEPAKLQQLRACWKQLGIPANTLVADFLLKGEFAQSRARTADCMGA